MLSADQVEDEVVEMVDLLPLDDLLPSQVAQPASSAQLAARSLPLVGIPPLQQQSGMTTEWQHASAVCKGAPYPLVWGDRVRGPHIVWLLSSKTTPRSLQLTGVPTRLAGSPHPWGATSCRKAAPLTHSLLSSGGTARGALAAVSLAESG